MIATTIILDIETIPSPTWPDYQAQHAKTKKRPGIHALVSEVACVGTMEFDDSHEDIKVFQCLSEDKSNCEVTILTDVYEYLASLNSPARVKFVTFNGFLFDFPFLRVRGMVRNVPIGSVLPREDKKYPASNHLDLLASFGGKWQTDVSAGSLDDMLWALTGKGKDTQGDSVAKWYEEGNHEAIAGHCTEDLHATRTLLNRMRGNYF